MKSNRDMTLHKILTAGQAGTAVCLIAKELSITPYEAFRMFIRSRTYALFRQRGHSYNLMGDSALLNAFLHERRHNSLL